jgi:Domain of unknown function (DUF5666)
MRPRLQPMRRHMMYAWVFMSTMSHKPTQLLSREVNKMNAKILPVKTSIKQSLWSARSVAYALCCSLLLSSCGGDLVAPGEGGSGSAAPDTPLVALGPIGKTAPLTVNGVSFATTAATETTIDALDDDGRGLQPGMMVRIESRRTAAPGEARATQITSGSEVRGRVESISLPTATFVSNGIAIDVTSTTRYEGLANGLASLQVADTVQVHGYPTGNNRVLATLVRKRAATTELKLTGNVSGLTQATECGDCKSTGQDFSIGGITIRPTRGTVVTDGSPIENGTLVRVSGFFDTTPNVFIATDIRRYEGAPPENGVGVALQGVFAATSKSFTEFSISGLPVRVDETTRIIDNTKFGATLAPGNVLEVEGAQEAGVVKATRVTRR